MRISGSSEELLLESQGVDTSSSGDELVVSLTGDELTISNNAGWRTGVDGGAYAVDSSGDFQLVVAAPELELTDGREIEGFWKATGDSLEVSGLDEEAQISKVTAQASVSLIKSVKRSTEKSKPRYIITPTVAGRAAPSGVHASFGWAEVVKKGVIKPSQGLKEQYVCHPMSKVARLKSTWNIEAWRPTVGLVRTVAALCNSK